MPLSYKKKHDRRNNRKEVLDNMGTTDIEQIFIKAQTLIEALPYIRDFNNKKVVVKYGGSAMIDKTLEESVFIWVTFPVT